MIDIFSEEDFDNAPIENSRMGALAKWQRQFAARVANEILWGILKKLSDETRTAMIRELKEFDGK